MCIPMLECEGLRRTKRQKNKKTFKQKVNEALLYLDMFCVFCTKKKPEIAM